ncbi:unnamed protein product [Arabidopsis halleri]
MQNLSWVFLFKNAMWDVWPLVRVLARVMWHYSH